MQSNKMEDNRQKVIEEIISTEQSYLEHLNLIKKFFKDPYYESQLIPNQVLNIVFGDIEPIENVNKELLHRLHTGDIEQAFLDLAPFLKLYSTYANKFKQGLSQLQDWEKKKPELTSFRINQELEPELKGLKLNALLITPVQRVPRYKLLLEELLQNTSLNHPNYKTLLEATKQISQVALHINEHICEHENYLKMLTIQRCLTNGQPKIIAPGRKFIKEGILMKVSRKKSKAHERTFFLFSDMLMYAKPSLLNNSDCPRNYVCCCILPIKHCSVETVLGNKNSGQGELFKINCRDESLLLYSDPETTQSWIQALNLAISAFIENRQSLRKESSAKRPMRRAAIVKRQDSNQKLNLKKRCRPTTSDSMLTPVTEKTWSTPCKRQRLTPNSIHNSVKRSGGYVSYDKSRNLTQPFTPKPYCEPDDSDDSEPNTAKHEQFKKVLVTPQKMVLKESNSFPYFPITPSMIEYNTAIRKNLHNSCKEHTAQATSSCTDSGFRDFCSIL